MDSDNLKRALEQLAHGAETVDSVLSLLGTVLDGRSSTDTRGETADACVDLDRERRCGFPEVVYGSGKTPEAVVAIFEQLIQSKQDCLATRVTSEQAQAVLSRFPQAIYNAIGRTIRLEVQEHDDVSGRVAVISAGTSDRPVAEEAIETLKWMRCSLQFIQDVGVAGPHRLLRHVERLHGMDAVVVIAGMEGALASVVAGHVNCPVFAVPTSVGYGTNFGGLAALLSMLNSCAANVAVVNIDAGFRGAYLAGMIAKRMARNEFRS